ncbi:MAG: GNAT family N-acetyltransferase [Wenzhouxiangella sp.]
MSDPQIRLNRQAGRFETTVEGNLCVLEFDQRGDRVGFNHVRVPAAVGGRGIAGRLTRHALDHARELGWRIEPNCPYVARWIERHPEYRDLVEK